jgi:ribosomal protein L35AE/L33A
MLPSLFRRIRRVLSSVRVESIKHAQHMAVSVGQVVASTYKNEREVKLQVKGQIQKVKGEEGALGLRLYC